MTQLSISNVINISVSESPVGLNAYNTSNIGLFSDETPDPIFDDGYKIYKEATEVGVDFGTGSQTFKMATSVFSQKPNILGPGGSLIVILMEPSELLASAVTRTQGLVSYFGVMASWIEDETEMLAAAAIVQALENYTLYAYATDVVATVQPMGTLDKIRTGGFTQTRGLLYIGEIDHVATNNFKAGYLSRGLSTNFNGSNTTQNQHLKVIAGSQPDTALSQATLTLAQTAGADCYPSIQGQPAVFTSGANKFFDQVYNLGWFVGALKVAGFNYLRQSSTKIPQTDNGVQGLVSAYRQVCVQAASNLYIAPGTWTSSTTFGNQDDLYLNIAQFGFYIYAAPIASQLQAAREGREAPLIQIAIKEAGAINSSSVIVNVNA